MDHVSLLHPVYNSYTHKYIIEKIVELASGKVLSFACFKSLAAQMNVFKTVIKCTG